MTKQEAKELYLNSDCSYFTMCTKYYAGYIEYRQLELPKSQEREWKNEKNPNALYRNENKRG